MPTASPATPLSSVQTPLQCVADRRVAAPSAGSAITRRAALAAIAAAATLPALSRRAAAREIDPATEWPQWRGPTGDNHAAAGASVPDAITEDRIAWRVKLPGRGHSTPVVVGDGLYLTTADKAAGKQSVLAVTTDGTVKWGKHIHIGSLPTQNHAKNTEASPSIASDGESLFVSFFNDASIQLSKLTLDGEVAWTKTAGPYRPDQYQYGYAASPTLYRDGDRTLVIVVGDYDGGGSFLKALDAADGSEVWAVDRPGRITFSSPIVANCGGRDRLLLSGGDQVACHDPVTGETLWTNRDATTMATCGTMVWTDDRVYASGGYPKAQTVCLDAADGSLVWDNSVKCYEQSMLAVGDHVYAIADGGLAFCWDAATGKAAWRERLGGNFSSSPILVGDAIHIFDESGQGYCFTATPDRFDLRSKHRIADEVFASPVVVGNTMYLRVADREGGVRQESLLAIK